MNKQKLIKLKEWIKKAWIKTGREFLNKGCPNAIFWTEQASLKYPFYYNLRNLVGNSKFKEIGIISEYNPKTPSNAKKCGNVNCNCRKPKKTKNKKQMSIDLCIVEFHQKIDVDYSEKREDMRSVWCFEHNPIIAMEFKYIGEYDRAKDLIEKDIEKLKFMGENYKTQLLYMCFVSNDIVKRKKLSPLLKKLKQRIRNKFHFAVGSYKINEWKVI